MERDLLFAGGGAVLAERRPVYYDAGKPHACEAIGPPAPAAWRMEMNKSLCRNFRLRKPPERVISFRSAPITGNRALKKFDGKARRWAI
jgi:hypothetical protein